MIGLRYLFLFALVFWVEAASILPAEDFELNNEIAEEFFDTYDGEISRFRRDTDDEKETTDRESNSAEGPGPRLAPDSGECVCPPPGAVPHPCQGLSRAACREKMTPQPYDGPPCELRPLFRMPTDFNRTARKECFNRWERPALEAKGFDFSQPHRRMGRSHFRPTLIINKGCDAQCMFLENKLVVESEDAVTISKEAVMEAMKEEDDPQELTDAYEEQINKCIDEAAELVHQKQSCKSGSDEFLACLKHNLFTACPGAKWKGNKSCTDVEDSSAKLRDCRREQRSMFMQRFHHSPKDGRHF